MSATALPAHRPTALAARVVLSLRRIGARIIDGFLITVPILIVAFLSFLIPLVAGLGVATSVSGPEGLMAGLGTELLLGLVFGLELSVLVVLIPLLYFRWAARRSGEQAGQTIGRQMVGIRVVRTVETRPLRGRTLLLREFALLLWMLPLVIAGSLLGDVAGSDDLGLLVTLALACWIAWRAVDGRLPHDRMTKTRTIEA